MRFPVIVALFLAVAAPAFAQGGTGIDCAKASTAVEHSICDNPDNAAADREMAALYGPLLARLTGSAKDHLVRDQERWIADRDRACTGKMEEVFDCLQRYQARSELLKALADGDYPFVSEHELMEIGKVGGIEYSFDATYPQFDGTSADFSALNRTFAENARRLTAESVPDAERGRTGQGGWNFEQAFELQRPGPRAIEVDVSYDGFTGGAHPFGGTTGVLVDLRTGKAATPEQVFAAGEGWLDTLVRIVGADLKKQFVDQPGFDEALEPANLAKLLRDPHYYHYGSDRLALIFDQYVVGPYVAGAYTVEIPYDKLKPLFSADGPLGP